MTNRIALVLGAGGAPGWMFHVGVLQGLREATGWVADDAEILIGTSAGSLVGAAVRAGATPEHIASVVDQPPSAEDRQVVAEEMKGRSRTLRPLSPGLARQALPGGNGLSVALSGLLPPGMFPTWPLTGRGRLPMPSTWDRLWIPATRVSDGTTTVFGRDMLDVAVADAVEASCAFPGLFQPKEIDGQQFVDGGASSPTHAHLALEIDPTLVVVSSPLSRPDARPLSLLARSRLREESNLVRRAGASLLVIEPPRAANRLFREYPRRNRSAGRSVQAIGRHRALEAVTAHTEARLRLAS